jgi:hypothetical protein
VVVVAQVVVASGKQGDSDKGIYTEWELLQQNISFKMGGSAAQRKVKSDASNYLLYLHLLILSIFHYSGH